MTQKQIIQHLNALPVYMAKNYAAKLVLLFNLVKDIKLLPGFHVDISATVGNCELVWDMPVLDAEKYAHKDLYQTALRQQNNCRDLFGEFPNWHKITVSHDSGTYNFQLPENNEVFNLFCELVDMPVKRCEDTPEVIDTIVVDSGIFKQIGKAVKFVSKDMTRPAMCCVCIDIVNGKLQVAGTDAHKMYYSKQLECSHTGEMQILISENDAKEIGKIKPENDLCEIALLSNNRIMVNGKKYACIDAKYPNYKSVIPEYKNFMEFNKKGMAENIKRVLPHANKVTNHVLFHLNGSVALSCCDVDFSFESNAEMPYINKSFPDMDIAFNGKFLLTTLDVFKDKTIKMYSESQNTRAAIFSNNEDNVLVMPLMIR